MSKSFYLGAALATVLLSAMPASAQTALGSYVARLSDNDHYASDGYKLDTAAQVVRQDRANWHRFGRGDPEDEDDPWFTSNSKRAEFEKLLNKSGAISQSARRAIMGGEPLVRVTVYRNSVKVEIVGN